MMIFLCNIDGVVVPEAAVSWSGPISPTLLANFSGGDQGQSQFTEYNDILCTKTNNSKATQNNNSKIQREKENKEKPKEEGQFYNLQPGPVTGAPQQEYRGEHPAPQWEREAYLFHVNGEAYQFHKAEYI